MKTGTPDALSDQTDQALKPATTLIEELTPQEAYQQQQSGALLIDVREPSQWAVGVAEQALTIARHDLPLELAERMVKPEQSLMLVCARGKQSLLAALELQALGYKQVKSVQGGFAAWKATGLPLVSSAEDKLTAIELQRYARHISLPEIGVHGQQRLLMSKVLLVGAGGLGSPAALYLAAAGVGCLGIVDDDHIERSNLQRQILHSDQMCGEKKILSAQQRLKEMNPAVMVIAFDQRLTEDNAEMLIADFDVIIDGSDNFETRYALNRACVKAGKPLVYAAVEGFQAQVAVFWPNCPNDYWDEPIEHPLPCYQCIFPQAGDGPSCGEAGVLGVVPGLAGVLQASEALKLCLQIGQPMVNKLLRLESLSMRIRTTKTIADPECLICSHSQVSN